MNQFHQQFITAIIDRYGLETEDDHVDNMVRTWLQTYDQSWIVKAIIESLYRGRYKVRSVDSILVGWQRVGKPACKFTPEFEREILHNLPAIAEFPETVVLSISSTVVNSAMDDELFVVQPLALSCDQLNPEESAPFWHHNRTIPTTPTLSSRQEIIADQKPHPGLDRPQPPLAIVPTQHCHQTQHQEDHQPNQTAPLAANFQLFQTLRAIIEPNHSQSDNLASFDVAPCIVNFGFSFSNVSGE